MPILIQGTTRFVCKTPSCAFDLPGASEPAVLITMNETNAPVAAPRIQCGRCNKRMVVEA